MKKIYLIIALALVLQMSLSHATTPQHAESNFEKYERYFDSLDNTVYGNYYLIQPGLYEILNQMPKEAGQATLYKYSGNPPADAYPLIFAIRLTPDKLSKIDTLRFNPQCDTLLCRNTTDIVSVETSCEVVSTIDTVRVFDISSGDPLYTHGFVYDPVDKAKLINLLKNWDEEKISKACKTHGIMSSRSIGISRIIIKEGKLVDIKFKRCKSIELESL